MLARLLFGSAFCILAPHVRCQDVVRFDTVRFNLVGSFAIGHSAFELDRGYRVFSIQKGQPDQSQDIYVTDFDSTGGVVAERTFLTYQQDWMGGSGPVLADSAGYYAGVARFGVLGYLDSLFLYRFDTEGDTMWTQFLAVDTAYLMRGLARTTAGDLLLTGLHYPPDEAYVLRVDSLGTIKSYHGYANFDGEDVVEGKDGGWYVCGAGNTGGFYNRPYLVRSDTNGVVSWSRVLSNRGFYRSLIALHDTCVLALGSIGYSPDTGGVSFAIKYDQAGVEQWRQELLQTDQYTRPSQFHAGFEALDSTLVICGWVQRSEWLSKGSVVKLNKNGELLWSHLYSHYDVSSISLHQIFWDVKPTRDGGLVLTGEANSAEYPYAQLWLLKLDSLGCLVPGCGSLGVQEVVTDLQGQLHISPNPARDLVQVSLSLPEGFATSAALQLYLLDAQGRIVLQQPAQENLNLVTGSFDVSQLASGTYYIHLADSKRWLAGGKLIVE